MSKIIKFETQLYDPRVSRIEKNIAKNRPKFLDLYASIYGRYLLMRQNFGIPFVLANVTILTDFYLIQLVLVLCVLTNLPCSKF